MAHDGAEPVPYETNIMPRTAGMGEGDVMVGQRGRGIAWKGADGHVYESMGVEGHFPDINRIVETAPRTDNRFRITLPPRREIPSVAFKNMQVGIEAEGGVVYMRYRTDVNDPASVERVKVGEVESGDVDGEICRMNPKYFYETAAAEPGPGTWSVSVPEKSTQPLRFDHESGRAVGIVMPMHRAN